MRTDLEDFSKSYRAALVKHMAQSPASSRKASLSLGRRAVKLGLETLELAKIHEKALVSLESTKLTNILSREKILRYATVFFTEVITPIEKTHQRAKEVNAQMKQASETLSRRTKELTALNVKLKDEIDQRKAAEASLRANEAVSRELLEKSSRLQEELRLLSHRLLSIQEAMRQHLSRELHNVIAQALTGLDLQLVNLKKKSATDEADFHAKIELTQQLVKKSVDILHRFARDLRPTILDDLGLIPALQSHLKDFMEMTGIRVTLNVPAELELVDIALRAALFRIAQEALNNIAQHSGASQTSVIIRQLDGSICMEIHDNGKGFDVNGVDITKSTRLGLIGMREHAEMLDGTFFIDSAPKKGTTLRVEIPYSKVHSGKRSAMSSVK